ncbi:hypothetical protein HWI79_2639 [Cryptosporidium felis]|nr:hypothetical protein HWI79_2639 [Cryptosporidium felis]
MLVIKEADYNSLWAELQWTGEKFERIMGYFRRYAGLEEGLSRKRLLDLLLDLGKSCYTVRGGVKSLTDRGDLCSIMSGSDMLSGSQFMCLAGLLDNSTPHSTSSPAGLLRLEMIFMYYDRGNKGYWDNYDWEMLMIDIQYPAKDGEKLVPYPLQIGQHINFDMLKRLVDTRRLRGTSQLLRVSFDSIDCEQKTTLKSIAENMSNSGDNNVDKEINTENSNIENKYTESGQLIDLSDNRVEYIKLDERIKYSPVSPNNGSLTERTFGITGNQRLQVFSPRKKVSERRSPSKRRPQGCKNKLQEESNFSRNAIPKSLITNSNAYQEGISSYMSRIPVSINSPNPNLTPRMAFRANMAPNSHYNDGMLVLFNQGSPSIVPNSVQNFPYQTPTHVPYHSLQHQYQQNYFSPQTGTQANRTSISGAKASHDINSRTSYQDAQSDPNNLNRLQLFGQSLQNVGQSLISMIPKVFAVPNITVGVDDYSCVSQSDVRGKVGKLNGEFRHSQFHDLQGTPRSGLRKVNESHNFGVSEFQITEHSSIDDPLKNGVSLPNFHSTYSNENYPMSIDLSRLGVEALPRVPENNSNLNSRIASNIPAENNQKAADFDDAKQRKSDNFAARHLDEKIIKRPIKIEEIDHFFTFLEQLLYNEIVGSVDLFDKIAERHDSSFQLSEKEETLIGPIMQLTTMDQFLLTFALSCLVSHQRHGNLSVQNEGVLGKGVSIDEIERKIQETSDLFHRIYRIMYQDLKNEAERNCDAVFPSSNCGMEILTENGESFLGFNILPYIVRMVLEKVKTAMDGDLDMIETIKDICVVYYHYLLESNESFLQDEPLERGPKGDVKYRSVEEMIEIVRQRYVVAMKMLSLNNSAKTNSARVKNAKEHISEKVRAERPIYGIERNFENRGAGVSLMLRDVRKDAIVPVAKSRDITSPHYPLQTATSSPNYFVFKQGNGGSEPENRARGNSSRRSLVLDSGESNPNTVPCLLQEYTSETENRNDCYYNKVFDNCDSGRRNEAKYAIPFKNTCPTEIKNYSHLNNSKALANVASYCPTEHTLTDKVPETRLERKSRIPSRIL